MQVCFLALTKKRFYRQTDAHVEADCESKHGLEYPEGNAHPRSLYVMKKLLGCKAVEKVRLSTQVHCHAVCACDK
jgi:hypothetical protein